MQNDAANNAVSQNNRHDHAHEERRPGVYCDAGMCRVRIHRTWSFWSFLLIPVVVVAGWTQYVSLGALPWLGITPVDHAGRWSDAMHYYIWLQLVWLPANMVMFLIWCALGVRVWNCKRRSHSC